MALQTDGSRLSDWLVTGRLEQFGISNRIDQTSEFGRIRRLDRDHPRLLVTVLVHQLRLGLELLVDTGNFATDRRKQIAQRLDTLDGAERFARRDRFTRLYVEVHERDVAKLVDSERGDSNEHHAIILLCPLVIFCVPTIRSYIIAGHDEPFPVQFLYERL